jgi:hypothetical protein
MHRHGTVALLTGVVGAARTHAVIGNTGDLSGCRGDLATPPSGDGRGRCRRGSYGALGSDVLRRVEVPLVLRWGAPYPKAGVAPRWPR